MKNFLGIGIVLLFGLIATFDLYTHTGFAFTHDGQDHIARIANFYLNLSQGVFIPRWAENLNWGYGHPILEFLYPLPSYTASLFHFLGLSFVDSTKWVFILAEIASGLTMYIFVKTIWGEKAGVVSGLLYMYAPYHFIDLYVRGDIGEHTAFVFVPLVFWGIYHMSKKKKIQWSMLSAIFLGLLILAHNAVALMMLPLILLYGVYLWWQEKWNKKFFIDYILFFIMGFLLSSFFWFPAFFEGQYTLRNIVTKGAYVTSFVSFGQLVYGKWSYGGSGMFTVQLGIIHWFSLLIGSIVGVAIWKKEKAVGVLLLGLILLTLCSIFLMVPITNFIWQKTMLLQNFQFPWRFLAVPLFTTSLLGGILLSRLSKRFQTLGVAILCIALLFLSKEYMHAKGYIQKSETFFTGIYNSTTDTGESAPIWSVRFMGQRFAKPLEVISGDASIHQDTRLVTKHTYTVSAKQQTRLLENTLYFPGWKVLVDTMPVDIQFQDPMYRGLMTFTVPQGQHTVSVIYQESKLRVIGDILSVIGILTAILLMSMRKYLHL